MLGAILGDCIGSFWEFSGNKDPRIPLWMPASHFTDDSVCTFAIIDWLLHQDQTSPAKCLYQHGRAHRRVGFGGKMLEWLQADTLQPSYHSWGNGSAMRVSPIALFAQSEQEALSLAEQSALPTHSHPDAIVGAQALVLAIRFIFENRLAFLSEDSSPKRALQHLSFKMGDYIEEKFAYRLIRDLDQERARHFFDVSCKGTVPLALSIAIQSHSFDEAMTWCCSLGGDADTLAAISGPIMEALYGIPMQHYDNAKMRFSSQRDLWDLLELMYHHPSVVSNLEKWGYSHGTLLPATGHTVPPLRMKLKQTLPE